MLTQLEPWLLPFTVCFTSPTAESFLALAAAWLLAVGPRTVTNLVRTLGAEATKSHDAYQYFFSGARWEPGGIFEILFRMVLRSGLIGTEAVIELAGDDTLLHHSGRRIFGVGIFRDAVRSSKKHVAYAWGHNWAILCVIVPIPFCPGTHLALPIHARLRVKAFKPQPGRKAHAGENATVVDLMCEMVQEVTSWAPQRQFRLLADGAYAALAGRLPANVTIVSRLRKDAALYDPPPTRRPGQPGRPPKKGRRLPTPAARAPSARLSWRRHTLTLYGQSREVLLHSYRALWYEVCAQRPISIVIVRDPTGEHDDEFFFSTDLALAPQQIVLAYGRRWSQEVVHREAKNEMGIQDPQARLQSAVERQAPFCLTLMSLVKLWYLKIGHRQDPLASRRDAWYAHKDGISFRDMLATLRYAGWSQRVLSRLGLKPAQRKTLQPLLYLIARAS